MTPFHALVKNGRVTLDEPTDLPEGQIVVLLPLDELLTFVDERTDADMLPTLVLAPRAWRKSKPVDAAAILDELRAM